MNPIKCPLCEETIEIEFDLHSEGWTADWFECLICGTTWKEESIDEQTMP